MVFQQVLIGIPLMTSDVNVIVSFVYWSFTYIFVEYLPNSFAHF